MELEVLGWPPDGPQLRLDHERFAYAGKFVMTDTGKAVGREADEVVAAASFSPDRTDGDVLRLRYITVRADVRGDGLGPALADFVAERAFERGFGRVKIAVNNPFAYEAMYRAGFAFTGEETGLAELVLVRPAERDGEGKDVGESGDEGGGESEDGTEREDEAACEDEDERVDGDACENGGGSGDAGELAGPEDGADRTYRDGLERFAERSLDEAARTFVADRLDDPRPAPGGTESER